MSSVCSMASNHGYFPVLTGIERVSDTSAVLTPNIVDRGADSEDESTAGAQLTDAESRLPSSRGWGAHKRRLERIGVAIERASGVTDNIAELSKDTEKKEGYGKCMNLTFDDGVWYKIPWEACCTWHRMEALLRTWFRGDEERLKDLEREHYTLKQADQDLMLPRIWEKLLVHDANIVFSWVEPSATSSRPGSPVGSLASEDQYGDHGPEHHNRSPVGSLASEEQPGDHGPGYHNRFGYTIQYYQKPLFSTDDDEFVSSSVYEEPVGFEVDASYEKVPALEEFQHIIVPRHASPHRKGGRSGKVKLRSIDRIGKKALKINSSFLLNVIRSVVTHTSDMPDDVETGLTTGIFPYPYKDLCLHIDALQDYRTQTSGLRARHSAAFNDSFDLHMILLQDYLERQPELLLKETSAKWSKPNPSTSFASIWLLLKPGSDVYVREFDGSLNAYVVDSVRGGVVVGKDGRRISNSYHVQLWHLILGSGTVRPWTRSIEIGVFDNDREITSLPLFPVRFRDSVDDGATRKGLIGRGRKYFQYCRRPNFLQYSGTGLRGGKSYKRARVVVEHASDPWHDDGFERPEHEVHIPMEDEPFGTSIRLAQCECQECKDAATTEEVHTMHFSDYRRLDPERLGELTPHQYMLMTSHMFAFVLRDRVYDLLNVGHLEDPVMAETAIDKLVIEPGNKEIIKAIAKIYTDNAPEGRFSADFISGKGEGQIILLHGPPGTGKTLTADLQGSESVAEFTKRPLLSITAADLGHQPDALERNLLRYFQRAADWDAIVLLDEADVYLEQRSVMDLQRNSIVSVFLRAMDYFQGILFLTTNRVGQFDEAFASRIHLSLGYNVLDDNARGQIWDNLFQKLREDHRKKIGPEIVFGISAKQYIKTKEVMALEWNGREIRNAFQTAVALAVYDTKQPDGGEIPYLTENHLEQVVAMSLAFKDYMKKTRQGMTESEWAVMRNNRYDSLADRSGTPRGKRTAATTTTTER
ncbi:uncharacterized protein M421DRAFT_91106 [Didymella exigua CBS 183.55]|uniref:AAA+ ATPase domain-containing protein n=1 Tax=Didymella exigua CBS 183.55 TaxID=1150837 RepID=A0A6A5RTX9_9PLEO|nr:uncharacterized protein M421DRAFT_91106 [Didymella exigua CBS 183.55]KAF1930614.1 hypothetical protein M421DRAFT_91106 [Didymella exigua CBS 183.55]